MIRQTVCSATAASALVASGLWATCAHSPKSEGGGDAVLGATGCPLHASNAPSSKSTHGCPVQHPSSSASYLAPTQYDVYGRAIDPRNKMPADANQQKAPGQRADLSTERVASTIPKAGSAATWEYPSPQMFWNALVRKGKADGTSEEEMATVVAVHNNMNELTWREVLEWEKLRDARQSTAPHKPRLSRFSGRPHELSLEAKLRTTLLGWPAPFDRHDWIVDRGGDEVRYIIDYYSDESLAHSDALPTALSDSSAIQSIVLDVRPALDSVQAVWDRFVAMPLLRLRGEASHGLPLFASPALRQLVQERERQEADDRRKALDAISERVNKACSDRFAALRDCGDDDKKCADAAIALQHCVATVVCPKEATAFQIAVTSNDKVQAEQAYEAMDAALERFTQTAQQAN